MFSSFNFKVNILTKLLCSYFFLPFSLSGRNCLDCHCPYNNSSDWIWCPISIMECCSVGLDCWPYSHSLLCSSHSSPIYSPL